MIRNMGGFESLKLYVLCFTIIIISVVFICSLSLAQEGQKVAVLYFADHSKFDSGGGCLSIWPLNYIFGTGQKREKWDLKTGFRDLLNQRLVDMGYKIIDPDDVARSMQETGRENLTALADGLDADIMIVGDIRKFMQHRTRARSQGPTTLASTADARMVAMGGIGGFFYSSTVNTDMRIYDGSGEELEHAMVRSKKNLRDFYMGVGPMTYHRGDTEEGAEELEKPIVSYQKLDKMKFGTDEFRNRTLFGMATMDVMDQIVSKVGEYLEPVLVKDVQGKIIYLGTGKRLKESEVYIDLGAGDGMRPGHKLGIYMAALKLTDPDTGEELGTVAEKKVGVLKVSKVEADHLSIAEIIERTGEIERGNIVKRE